MVDIIVTVYNVEKYLRECIDSILNQSYKKIELILVDDGSTDNSGAICDEYALKDHRIKVIHKENGGLVSAWISGIENSSNNWIVFSDADDWIETNHVKCLVEEQQNSKADIVVTRMKQVKADKEYYIEFDAEIGTYSGSKLINELYPIMINTGEFEKRGVPASRCSKLIRKELLINNIKYVYPRATYKEDFNIMYPTMMDANIISLICVEKAAYCYRMTEGSMLHGYDRNMYNSTREVNKRVIRAAKDKGATIFLEQLRTEYLSSMIRCFTNELVNPDGIRRGVQNVNSFCTDQHLSETLNRCDWKKFPPKYQMIIHCFIKPNRARILLSFCVLKIAKRIVG